MTNIEDKKAPELVDIAVRVDVSKKDSLACVEQINKYLSCVNYIWAFEIAKDTKKPHIHGNVKIKIPPNVSIHTRVDTFRKWMSRSKWCKGKKGCFSVETTKIKERYLRYIGKDADIISTTYTEEQLEHIEQMVMEFKMSQNRSMIDKLFYHVTGYYMADYELDVHTPLIDQEVAESILEFYLKNNLLFPNKTQLFQYVATIMYRTGNKASIFASYTALFIPTDRDAEKAQQFLQRKTTKIKGFNGIKKKKTSKNSFNFNEDL